LEFKVAEILLSISRDSYFLKIDAGDFGCNLPASSRINLGVVQDSQTDMHLKHLLGNFC
jgi:hypothetical protein